MGSVYQFESGHYQITIEHITYEHLCALDASIIISEVIKELGYSFEDLIPKYFSEAKKNEK